MSGRGWSSWSGRNRELRRANEILKSGERDPQERVGFLQGGARPPVPALIAHIDENKERFGVEPICRAKRARSTSCQSSAEASNSSTKRSS
jgi:hypothetical protein